MPKTANRMIDLLQKRQHYYRADPVLFFQEVIGYTPDEWQTQVARDVARCARVSVRSGQGVGKTSLEAVLLLWFLSCHPYSRVVATAPTRQQLHDVLWAEVAKWRAGSPLLTKLLAWNKNRVSVIGQESKWFAVARTAGKPENMQGFHAGHMLFIVDEASGVADPVLEAVLGTLSGPNNKLLLCGNPTRTSGIFYDSHTKNRAHYAVRQVSARDCVRTNPETIRALEESYGRDSNVVRVRVDGEFPTAQDDEFISLALAESAVGRETEEGGEGVELGVDVARFGDDETVIACKVNGGILPLVTLRGRDLMWTTGQTLAICRQLREARGGDVVVKIDDTGLGGGVTDRLKELKTEEGLDWLTVVPVNFAGRSPDRHYGNIATYMWAKTRDLLQSRALALPDDNALVAQLVTRRYGLNSAGRVVLEKKKEMKARGLPSPDRADAVCLACLPVVIRGRGKSNTNSMI